MESPSIHPSLYLSVHPSLCPPLSVHLSPSVSQSLCPSPRPPLCLSSPVRLSPSLPPPLTHQKTHKNRKLNIISSLMQLKDEQWKNNPTNYSFPHKLFFFLIGKDFKLCFVDHNAIPEWISHMDIYILLFSWNTWTIFIFLESLWIRTGPEQSALRPACVKVCSRQNKAWKYFSLYILGHFREKKKNIWGAPKYVNGNISEGTEWSLWQYCWHSVV